MKIRNYLIMFVSAIAFTSCQITENIYLQEDGSGQIVYDIDASELMALAGDQLGEMGKKNIDSTMTFKQLFEEKKDSIAKMPLEEQQRLKKFEDVSMHMQMNAAQKVFKISLLNNFKKAAELQDMMQAMKVMKSLDNKAAQADNPLGSMMDSGANTDLKYSFDGKTFRRSLKITDPKLNEKSKDSTGMVKMTFSGSKYILKYHFPKKVKSVSNPNALFSDDRRTITIPYSLVDYMEQPETMSFEVILDKK